MNAGSFKHVVGGDGTVLVSGGPCRLFAVVVGKVAAAQTLTLHDCAVTGDVAAGNKITVIELDTRESLPFGMGALCRVGLVAVMSGGAGDTTIVFG